MVLQAERLAAQLKRFQKEVDKCTDEKQIDAVRSILTVPMCKAIQIIVSDMNKVNEILYADEHREEGLRVNNAVHGADLINDETGGVLELKTAKYLAGEPRKPLTFSFGIGSAKLNVESRREHMIHSFTNKTKGLGIHLEVKDYKQRRIAEYRLSHKFSIAMFQRIPISENSTTYSITTAVCEHCSTSHRLDKIAHYGRIFDLEGMLTESQWTRLFSKTKRQCDGRGVEF